ncbi:hypothetical protein BJ546DRAFT_956885 [Cryomyces antarcticus]
MTTASNDEDDNEGLENDSDDERDQEEGVEEGNRDVVLDPLHDQHPHQYRGTRAFRRREAQIRWANMTAPVDGKLTCGLFQHCHLPQEHGLYCQYHSLSLDRLRTQSYQYTTALTTGTITAMKPIIIRVLDPAGTVEATMEVSVPRWSPTTPTRFRSEVLEFPESGAAVISGAIDFKRRSFGTFARAVSYALGYIVDPQ